MSISDILNAGKAGGVSAKAKALLEEEEKEIKILVAQFSNAWWEEKLAKERKEKIRQRLLEYYKNNGVELFDGNEGLIKVVQIKDSIGLIAKEAKKYLTEEQIKECTGVTRKGFAKVDFTPKTKGPEVD